VTAARALLWLRWTLLAGSTFTAWISIGWFLTSAAVGR